MAISGDIALKDKAARYGFTYNSITHEFVNATTGARIPCDVIQKGSEEKLLWLMNESQRMSDAADAMSYVSGAWPPQSKPKVVPSEPPKARSYYEKLAVRLDVPAGETFPFDHAHIIDTSTEVCVLIKVNDQVVLLKDDKNLFPSDSLLASIRLLL